jgi:hypothetical protein
MRSPKNVLSVFMNVLAAKKTLRILLPAFLLITVAAYAGKEFWETKPFDEWTLKECQRILENSPWAKELKFTAMSGGGGSEATDGGIPYVKYVLQFQSAAPIRQATVRQMQIVQKYDSFSAEQKKDFIAKIQPYLEASFSDFVVVTVSFSSNNRQNTMDLLRHWQTRTIEMMKNAVYISGSKGDKIKIAQFVPVSGAKQEFQFIFPRHVNGKEVLSPEDKALRIEFEYPVIGGLGDGRGNLEFKLDKMKVNDDVVY